MLKEPDISYPKSFIFSYQERLEHSDSAYRSFHSNETLLLKIQNDISTSVDSGKAVALTLLDLFTAFNTIDHAILYDCLKDWFGVDGTVLTMEMDKFN